MKVEFVTNEHKFEQIAANKWRLLEPFVARVVCDEQSEPILVVVPGGYETDFESVPRALVLSYTLIKGKARKAATLHDYLLDHNSGKLDDKLRTRLLPFTPTRQWIDKVFYYGMVAQGTNAIARELAYAGVSAYTALTTRGE